MEQKDEMVYNLDNALFYIKYKTMEILSLFK